MIRLITFLAAMLIYWALLSGHTKPWLIYAGIGSSLAVLFVGLRMAYIDGEGHPIRQLNRGLIYWPWLLKEIIVSALDVSKLIVDPNLPISPVLVRIKASQKSAVGLTTYANSITLTPGTISALMSSRDREIVVHAISKTSALGLKDGEMDRRVTWFEGEQS